MRGSIKALAIIVCAFFVISPFTAMIGGAQTGSRDVAIPKIVVGELFTGLWCGYCKYAEQAMDNIVDDASFFDDRFVLVEWHNGDKYAIPEGAARESYYAVSGFPTARFDGIDSQVGAGSTAAAETAYETKINNRAKTADAFVEIDAKITGQTLNVWVNVTLVNDISLTNLVVQAITIQDENITDGGGLYPIRMTAENWTIRDAATTISKKGEVASKTGSTTVDPAWTLSKMRVVAWLQSNTNKEIVNGNINYIKANGGMTKNGEIPAATFNEDATFNVDLKSYYADPENDKVGPFTFTATTVKGTMDKNSVLTLTPPPEWSGTDSAYLVISDGMNMPIDFTFGITVNNVNDAPLRIKSFPNLTMLEGTTKTNFFNVKDYFSDIDDQTLTYTYTGNDKVNVTLKTDGTVTFQAPIGFSGVETITFTATDSGALKASGDMKVTVTDVNFAPKQLKAIPDVNINEDQTDKSIKLTDYFSDIDSELQYSLSGFTNVVATIGTDMVITLAPKADWNGVETGTVTVTDTVNKALTDQFVVNVNPVNDAPTLTGTAWEEVKFSEDTDYTTEKAVGILFTDKDGPTMTYSASTGDSDLTITLNSDYTISFHPAKDWNGEKTYWIKGTDGQYTVQYNASVKVESVNDGPSIDSFVPTSPSANINEGESIDYNIVASDVAAEKETLVFTWTINDKPAGDGTAALKFETDFNSSGKYTIKVVVSDGELTDSHSWSLTVKNVNRKPTVDITSPAATDAFRSDTPITFKAAGADADGDKITYQWSIDGVSIGAGDTVTSLVAGGAHTVKVTASDGNGGSAEKTMAITVKLIKKNTNNGGVGGSTLMFALIGVVIAVIVVVMLVLMMRKKKPAPAAPTEQAAQLPPPPPPGYEQQQPTQPYDPNAGYYQPPPQYPPQ